MNRYSLITKGLKREFLLLQGTGCIWKKCTFCDYHTDISLDPFSTNKSVLDRVSGAYGVLDIINSGSCFELDNKTLSYIYKIAKEKNIHTIWFECHFLYRSRLNEFRSYFDGINLKFRVGVESFNGELREAWKKGIPSFINPWDIASYFDGCCLLVGVQGESKEDILNDIEIAEQYFEYYSVNLFCPNSSSVKLDKDLEAFVKTEVKEILKKSKKAELLIENTDLGVG